MTEKPTIRRFRVGAGRVVTLPIDIKPGPGRTNHRFLAGEEFELEVARCNANQRYLAGRLNAGDLEELAATDAPPSEGVALKNVTPARARGAGDQGIATGAPLEPVKE